MSSLERPTPIGRALRGVLLAVVALLWLGPYAWMTITSLKSLDEIVQAPAYPLPHSPNLDAYREVMTQVPVGRYLFNTLVMAFSIAALQILLALPAGYALAKLRFRGRRTAFSASFCTTRGWAASPSSPSGHGVRGPIRKAGGRFSC